jgi:hypothetical protein
MRRWNEPQTKGAKRTAGMDLRLLYVIEGRLRVQVKPLLDVDDGFGLTTVEQRYQLVLRRSNPQRRVQATRHFARRKL